MQAKHSLPFQEDGRLGRHGERNALPSDQWPLSPHAVLPFTAPGQDADLGALHQPRCQGGAPWPCRGPFLGADGMGSVPELRGFGEFECGILSVSSYRTYVLESGSKVLESKSGVLTTFACNRDHGTSTVVLPHLDTRTHA